MKIIAVVFAALLFCLKASSQTPVDAHSAVETLKTYLAKNIRYPAVAAENDVHGQMVIAFKINSDERISEIEIVMPLFPECDSAVVQALRKYPEKLLLLSAKYTFGLQFVLVKDGKQDPKVTPFDKSLSDNFLFELNINRFVAKRKVEIVY